MQLSEMVNVHVGFQLWVFVCRKVNPRCPCQFLVDGRVPDIEHLAGSDIEGIEYSNHTVGMRLGPFDIRRRHDQVEVWVEAKMD